MDRLSLWIAVLLCYCSYSTQAFLASQKDAALRCPPTFASKSPPLTHADIVWKVRPPEETSRWERLKLKLAGWGILLDCKLITRQPPPTVLCPRGGQAVLEAWHERRKIGRFGITTEAGPCLPVFQETCHDLFGIDPQLQPRTAAIRYMVIEPECRGRNLGYLALEAIRVVHAVQGCDYTILIADDKSENSSEQKLVQWYERFGYVRAPKLQAPLGSPDGQFGITMMAPTDGRLVEGMKFRWW